MTSWSQRRSVDRLNVLLDRVPRTFVDVGARRLPVFRSLGIVGFQLGVACAALVSLLNGLPLTSALGLSAVAALSFVGWGLARRAVTGRETLVLLEHVWVAFAAVGAFLWLSGASVRAGLDVLSVGVCCVLAFGRLGCAATGCCHGVPARVGLRYGPAHGLAPRLTGRRLLPVQLVEAAGIAAIGLVGLALTPGTPGRATVWFATAYAVLRFGCESLRGDRRPALLGVSVPRLMCLVQVATALWAAETWLVPGEPGRPLGAAGAALGLAALVAARLSAARGRDPLVVPEHLDEVWALLTALGPPVRGAEPVVGRTSRDTTVAVGATADGDAWHVSLSHPTRPTEPLARALAPDALVPRGPVTHLVLVGPTSATVDRARQRRAAPAPATDDDSYSDGDGDGDRRYFARTAGAADGWLPAGDGAPG